MGAYTYGTETHQPHAVQSTSDGVTYNYDHTGNMLSDSSGRQLDYTVFDKPDQISKGNSVIQFAYGPDRSRYLRIDTDTGTGNTRRTHYVGGAERVEKADGSVEVKRYLAGGAMWVHNFDANGVETQVERRYLHKDHQGSTQLITNQQGQVEQSLAFNPWGERVNNLDWNDLLTASLLEQFDNGLLTNRGYTGHEMLDAVGLVHMNGRIFDARLARFMQADPVIQAAVDAQTYNRYAYTRNNPGRFIDPSGYSFIGDALAKYRELKRSGLRKMGKDGAKIFAMMASGTCLDYWGAICSAHSSYEVARAFGVPRDYAFGAGMISGISAAAFQFIGDTFTGMSNPGGADTVEFAGLHLTEKQVAGYILSHAVAGGVMSVLQGGKFGHGFVAAGLGLTAGGLTQDLSVPWRFLAAVVAGGTASEITGGKFSNGAMTAAFAFLNNELKHLAEAAQKGLKPTEAEYKLIAEGKLAEMWQGRCAAGDPIGCVGFATWGDPADVIAMHGKVDGAYWVGVGATVRFNARNGLLTGNPELLLNPDALNTAVLSFGKAIATAHLDATSADLSGRHYFLSAPEITNYHHAVFDQFNVSRRWYGGSYGTGRHEPLLEPFYCRPSCDSN